GPVGPFGRSSASGAAPCHALQRPSSERVLKTTVPGPCQCRPTRSKRAGALTEASARAPATGRSRETIVAAAARATPGTPNAAVILLDTPGGLSESMRKIVQKELGLPIPVVVYVSPAGARAASAGVWITEAGDVAAMGPETNIGSSTPINGSGSNIGSDLRRKVINDAAASVR